MVNIRAALVSDPKGEFAIRNCELESPVGNEILVRIVATGICHTDLLIKDGLYPTPMPVVLGHEGAGVIEKVGPDVRNLRVGDSVILSFGACGQCPTCRLGKIAYCWHHMEMNFSGRRFDGEGWSRPSPISMVENEIKREIFGAFFQQSSLSTYSIATEMNAVKVAPDLPLSILAPLGCGFQTGAGAVMNSLPARAGEPIAITGTGAVGMAAIMAAVIVGCSPIIAIDRRKDRLLLAASLGATHTILADNQDLSEAVRSIEPNGVSVSIETTGSPIVFRSAVDMLRVGGTCGLIAGAKYGTEVTFNMSHILFGRNIRGILQGDSDLQTFIPELVRLYTNGQFPIDRLIKHYPFVDLNQAATDMRTGDVIKPVLLM